MLLTLYSDAIHLYFEWFVISGGRSSCSVAEWCIIDLLGHSPGTQGAGIVQSSRRGTRRRKREGRITDKGLEDY